MPLFYFSKYKDLESEGRLVRQRSWPLSKFRHWPTWVFCGGILMTLFTAQAAIASQVGKQLPYRECFEATAKTYNLDSDWLTAIAIVESSLNPKAVSSANAVGLMQIKWPQTAAHLGARTRAALFDPCTNVDLGGRYLRELTDRYAGDMQKALAAYRIGPTALARSQREPEVVVEYRRRINEQLDILRPNVSAEPVALSPGKKPAKSNEPRVKAVVTALKSRVAPSQPAQTERELAVPDETSAPIEVAQAVVPPPRCDLRALQLESLSTHHPIKREQRFFTWLRSNGDTCTLQHLFQIKNQMTVWLGTAAGSKRINLSLEKLLHTQQNPQHSG